MSSAPQRRPSSYSARSLARQTVKSQATVPPAPRLHSRSPARRQVTPLAPVDVLAIAKIIRDLEEMRITDTLHGALQLQLLREFHRHLHPDRAERAFVESVMEAMRCMPSTVAEALALIANSTGGEGEGR